MSQDYNTPRNHRPYQRWHFLFGLALSGLLAACGTSLEVKQIDPSADPSAELSQLKEALDTARQNNVHLFSPNWFAKANSNYSQAAALRKKGGDIKSMLESTALAQAQLGRAQKSADIARRELKSVFDARTAATLAGAPELYRSEFASADEEFMDLAKAIENDNISSARRGAKDAENAFRLVEMRSVKEHTLGKVRDMIRQAINQGAKKYAPKTLASTQTLLKDTDKFITKNPRAHKKIQEKAETMLRTAEHLQLTVKQAKNWSRLSAEDRVRWVENKVIALEKLAAGEEAGERVQSLNEHFDGLARNFEALQGSQKFLNSEISRLQLQSQQYTAEVKELSEEKRKRQQEREFAAKFGRVRNLFTSREAEVYRQGNELLVRLKGLNFEVGKSYVLPKHYPLLTKVQNSVRIFDAQKVVVEGHTDTSGSKATNERLSQERAAAVVAYLVNNNTIATDKITAIGYGPAKPIAPNTSKSGRKLNRRIDVVLKVK